PITGHVRIKEIVFVVVFLYIILVMVMSMEHRFEIILYIEKLNEFRTRKTIFRPAKWGNMHKDEQLFFRLVTQELLFGPVYVRANIFPFIISSIKNKKGCIFFFKCKMPGCVPYLLPVTFVCFIMIAVRHIVRHLQAVPFLFYLWKKSNIIMKKISIDNSKIYSS